MDFLNIKLQKLINEKKQYFYDIIQLYYSKLIDKYYLFFNINNNSNTLLIKPENENVKSYYKNHSSYNKGDSGLDLFVPEDTEVKCGETVFVDLQIKCELLDKENKNISYYLYPRSSISKTPLILANSVGIIDAGYRGSIKAAVKYIPSYDNIKSDEGSIYIIKKGTRLFQLCSPDLKELKFKLVNTLSETSRGEGGFGSTGITI
jgi:dUTP pyrophosphatase